MSWLLEGADVQLAQEQKGASPKSVEGRQKAFERATEAEKLSLGIIYKSPQKPSFEENVGIYDDKQIPLYEHDLNKEELSNLIETFKM